MGNQNFKNENGSDFYIRDLNRDLFSSLKKYLNIQKKPRPFIKIINDPKQRSFKFQKSNIIDNIYSLESISLSQSFILQMLTCLDKDENNIVFGKSTFIPELLENDLVLEDDIKLVASQNEMFDYWIKPIPNTETAIDNVFKTPFEFKSYITKPSKVSPSKRTIKTSFLRKKTLKKTVKGFTLIRRGTLKKRKKNIRKIMTESLSNLIIDNEFKDPKFSSQTKEKLANTIIEDSHKENDNTSMKKLLCNTSRKHRLLLKQTCIEKIIQRNHSMSRLVSTNSQNKLFLNLSKQPESKSKPQPFKVELIKRETFTKRSSELNNHQNKEKHSSIRNEVKPIDLVIDIRQLENEDKVLFDFSNFNTKIESNRNSIEQIPRFIKDVHPNNTLNSNFNIHHILNNNNVNFNNKNHHIIYNNFKESRKIINKTNNINNKSINKEKSKIFSNSLVYESPKKSKKIKTLKQNSLYSKEHFKKDFDSLHSDPITDKNKRMSKRSVNQPNPKNQDLYNQRQNENNSANIFKKNEKHMSKQI